MNMDEYEIEVRDEARIMVGPVDEDNEIAIEIENAGMAAIAYLNADDTVVLIEILRSRLPIEVRP